MIHVTFQANGVDAKELANLKAEVAALKNTVNEKMSTIETQTARIEELEKENTDLLDKLSAVQNEVI